MNVLHIREKKEANIIKGERERNDNVLLQIIIICFDERKKEEKREKYIRMRERGGNDNALLKIIIICFDEEERKIERKKEGKR